MEKTLALNALSSRSTPRKITYLRMLNFAQNVIWAVLLFLSFSLPVNFQPLKIVLLLLLILISLIKIAKGNYHVNKYVLILLIVWLCFCIPVSLIGFANNNPGAEPFARVELLYPLLLFIAVMTIRNRKAMKATFYSMIASSFFISAYTILLLLNNSGYIQIDNFWIIDDTSAVGLHEGYTHITNTNLSMLIFIFPCLASLTAVERKKLHINSVIYFAAIFVSFLAMFLSGRRILWLIAAFSLLVFLLRMRIKISKKIIVLVTLLVIAITFNILGGYFDISIEGLWERFLNVFSKTDEFGGENVRYVQMDNLIQGFKDNWVLGAGGGATLPDYYRSSKTPWIFEASYHMILFNSGLFFSAIYILFFLLMIIYILKRSYKHYLCIPIFCAFISAVIANATNPYFSASFDFLFFVFVPILFLNNKSLCKKGGKKRA